MGGATTLRKTDCNLSLWPCCVAGMALRSSLSFYSSHSDRSVGRSVDCFDRSDCSTSGFSPVEAVSCVQGVVAIAPLSIHTAFNGLLAGRSLQSSIDFDWSTQDISSVGIINNHHAVRLVLLLRDLAPKFELRFSVFFFVLSLRRQCPLDILKPLSP